MFKLKEIRTLTGLSPLAVLGIFVILVPVFVLMTMDNIREQHGRIEEKLTGKGLLLIRSFEAGTRTGMITTRWGARRVQRLLAETAQQPGIDYMMITNNAGRILAHSDVEKVGALYDEMPDISFQPGDPQLFHREMADGDGVKYFQVYKVFTPARHQFRKEGPGFFHRKHPPVRGARCRDCPMESFSPEGEKDMSAPPSDEADWFRSHFSSPEKGAENIFPRQVVFAAINMDAVEKMRQRVVTHAIFMGCLFLALGVVGVVCVLALQGYRSARSSLTRMKAFSDEVIATMPAGLITMDMELNITSCNGATLEMLHSRPGEGAESDFILPREMHALLHKLKAPMDKVSEEVSCTVADGTLLLDVTVSFIRSDSGASSGYLFLFHDLTELKAMKKEVERSRRLAAVGKLAAGVAHEIRNPLSSIKGFATCFFERYGDIKADREMAQTMIREVERLNRAVTQLLEFARPMPVEPREVDPAALVAHSLRLIARDLDQQTITVNTVVDVQGEGLKTDPDRVNQILLNLYLNALQAMAPRDTLTVRVGTSRRGTGVIIEVIDTGRGIPEENLDKIFDPYFTTRPDGTGLGLAMVHRTVEALGGDIRVESTQGEGTRFIVHIPSMA